MWPDGWSKRATCKHVGLLSGLDNHKPPSPQVWWSLESFLGSLEVRQGKHMDALYLPQGASWGSREVSPHADFVAFLLCFDKSLIFCWAGVPPLRHCSALLRTGISRKSSHWCCSHRRKPAIVSTPLGQKCPGHSPERRKEWFCNYRMSTHIPPNRKSVVK